MCWHSVTKTLFAKGVAGVVRGRFWRPSLWVGATGKEKIIEVNTP